MDTGVIHIPHPSVVAVLGEHTLRRLDADHYTLTSLYEFHNPLWLLANLPAGADWIITDVYDEDIFTVRHIRREVCAD